MENFWTRATFHQGRKTGLLPMVRRLGMARKAGSSIDLGPGPRAIIRPSVITGFAKGYRMSLAYPTDDTGTADVFGPLDIMAALVGVSDAVIEGLGRVDVVSKRKRGREVIFSLADAVAVKSSEDTRQRRKGEIAAAARRRSRSMRVR